MRKKNQRERTPDNQTFSTIPALETFKASLEHHFMMVIRKTDSLYCTRLSKRFNDSLEMKLPPFESLRSCVPLLNNRYSKLARLCGSMHEVRLGWKRLIEVLSLFKLAPPSTTNKPMASAHWLKFCSDSLWYADYGFYEKIICFLKTFQRSLPRDTNSPELNKIKTSLHNFEELRKVIKKGRDPLAHTQSMTIDEPDVQHFWQLYLVISYGTNFYVDPAHIIDYSSYMNKNTILKQSEQLVQSNFDIVNALFTDLNSLSLKNLTT